MIEEHINDDSSIIESDSGYYTPISFGLNTQTSSNGHNTQISNTLNSTDYYNSTLYHHNLSQNSEIVNRLNQQIHDTQLQIEKIEGLTNKNRENFFEGNQFYKRSDARAYIINLYGIDKKLIEDKDKIKNSFRIHLRCSCLTCSFYIVCIRTKLTPFSFRETHSCLHHGVYNTDDNSFSGFCTARKNVTTVLFHYI